MLPQATVLVSNGNNIVACNFECFAAKMSKAAELPLEIELVAHHNRN